MIPINAMDSEAAWKTVQIQISWLLMKPADLDLHCFLKWINSESAGQRLRPSNGTLENSVEADQIQHNQGLHY